MTQNTAKSRPYDSTAAMANAYFGTPGCGGAIDRVFDSPTAVELDPNWRNKLHSLVDTSVSLDEVLQGVLVMKSQSRL